MDVVDWLLGEPLEHPPGAAGARLVGRQAPRLIDLLGREAQPSKLNRDKVTKTWRRYQT